MLRRRNRRKRFSQSDRDDILEHHPLPSLQDIKNALCGATASSRTILRLALLMDNVSLHHAPGYIGSNDFTGRTSGVREYFRKDGYLISRYDTLMRFARLGKFLRLTSSFGDWDMSQATFEKCPEDFDDFIYGELQEEFKQYEGMNFKQIYARAERYYTDMLHKTIQSSIDREKLCKQLRKNAFTFLGWR